jgi:hypothetical protein
VAGVDDDSGMRTVRGAGNDKAAMKSQPCADDSSGRNAHGDARQSDHKGNEYYQGRHKNLSLPMRSELFLSIDDIQMLLDDIRRTACNGSK